MGTNYYAHLNVCSHCNKAEEIFHIGKSSFGWTFSFRGHKYNSPTGEPLLSYIDWVKFLMRSNVTIKDEYDRVISYQEFIDLVESKKTEPNNHTVYVAKEYPSQVRYCWTDQQGNSFSDQEFS